MKNLRKLSKRELRTIDGGSSACPPPATTCVQWCTWTPQQRRMCRNMIIDPDPCDC